MICAGMGGGLMMRILAEDREKTDSFHELILQPQSEIEKFRRFLRESGYRILDEEMVEEDGKFYQAIRAAAEASRDDGGRIRMEEAPSASGEGKGLTAEKLCKLKDRYGPVLIKKKTPVFFHFLEREALVYKEILLNLRGQGLTDDKRRARFAQVEELLADNSLVRDL